MGSRGGLDQGSARAHLGWSLFRRLYVFGAGVAPGRRAVWERNGEQRGQQANGFILLVTAGTRTGGAYDVGPRSVTKNS